jgi:hypothetical protein
VMTSLVTPITSDVIPTTSLVRPVTSDVIPRTRDVTRFL